MTIHEVIKSRRLALGLSLQTMAEEISLLEGLDKPLSWQTIQQWERGKTAPKRKRLATVATVLNMSVAELLSLEGVPGKAPGEVDGTERADLALRLQSARTARKVTQKDAAEKIGLTVDQLQAIESGVVDPSIWVLREMALLYDYSIDALAWDRALSPEAIAIAAQFDHLPVAQQDAVKAMLLAFGVRFVTDGDVEAKMEITKGRPSAVLIDEVELGLHPRAKRHGT